MTTFIRPLITPNAKVSANLDYTVLVLKGVPNW